jgi:flagellar capping protein FliD
METIMGDSKVEQKVLTSFKNQVLAILIGMAVTGLWMNYNFLTTINFRINMTDKNVDEKFEGVNKRLDKMESRIDEVYKEVVPKEKRTPNF